MAGWNNGQVMEPGVYVNEPKPKASKKKGSAQSGALSFSMEDLVEALAGHTQGMISEQPMPKQTAAPKEPKETALKLPGLSGEMGGLAQALVGARRSRQQRYASTDPWSIGQSVIEDPGLAEGLGMKLDKPWKQGLFNIAQNLIGGYVGGKARQGLAEYDRPFMQAIQGAAQSGDFSKLPISSEDDPTGVLQMSLALSGIDDKKAQRDAYNKELVKNGMLMNADGSFSRIPGYAEMRGQIKQAEDGKTGLGMAQALIGAKPETPFDFGTSAPSYDQKWTDYVKTNLALGMTENEAAKQATTRMQDERKFMGSSMTDAKTARDRAAMLEGIVGTAEGALAKDPYVGPLSGVWNSVSSLFGGEGAQGYAELNSLKQDLQKAYRVPGSGAQSDTELRALIQSGPSTDKTPEQNQAILNKIKKAAENEKQFADFMENYVQNTGEVTQGRQAWERYRTENNPFDDKPDTPWQDFFKRKAPAQTSGIDYGLPPGLPPETQAYVPKVFQGAPQLDMQTLLDRIRQVESGGNPNAVSPKGAKGAYQFLDGTAIESMQELGMDPSTYNPRNEQQQRVLAEHYINKLTKMLGSQQLAVAAYNAGPGRVQQLLKQGQQQAPAQMASNAAPQLPPGAKPLGKTPPKTRKPGTQIVRNDSTGEYFEVPA